MPYCTRRTLLHNLYAIAQGVRYCIRGCHKSWPAASHQETRVAAAAPGGRQIPSTWHSLGMAQQHVPPHTRSDGTRVSGYTRRSPGSASEVDAGAAKNAAALSAGEQTVDPSDRPHWWPSPSARDELPQEVQDGLARVCGNDDYVGMRSHLTRGSEFGLNGRKAYSEWKEQYAPVDPETSDYLGYWISSGGRADPGAEAMTAAVADADAPPERIEAACVMATDMIAEEELDELREHGNIGRTPSSNMTQHRHTLMCIAAHPNATPRAARQAIRAEGKYTGREVLRHSSDPDLLRFALDNADVGVWYATDEEGNFNAALPADRLDRAVDHVVTTFRRTAQSGSPAPQGIEYEANLLGSLAAHPNLTEEQRSRLDDALGPQLVTNAIGRRKLTSAKSA